MQTLTALMLSIFPALMIAAALCDISSMKIPNRISALLILSFFPTAFVVGLSPMAVLACVGVGVGALVVGMGMFALRWVGGGDAKVMAAAGLWLGVTGMAPFLMWTAVAGGLFAVTLLTLRPWVHPYLANGPRWMGRLFTPKGDIPYGVAICAGALAAFPDSPVLRAFSGLF